MAQVGTNRHCRPSYMGRNTFHLCGKGCMGGLVDYKYKIEAYKNISIIHCVFNRVSNRADLEDHTQVNSGYNGRLYQK